MKARCFIGEDPASVIAAADAAMAGVTVHSRSEGQTDSYQFSRVSAGDLAPDIASFLVTGVTTGTVYSVTVLYDP